MTMLARNLRVLRGAELLPRDARGKQTLEALLLRLRPAVETPVFVRGWAVACGDGDHDLRNWIDGWLWTRHLLLQKCANCEAVVVRDRTVDFYPHTHLVNSPDDVLGWYSGARAAGRAHL